MTIADPDEEPGGRRGAAAALDRAQRNAEILRLAKAGFSQSQIAKVVGLKTKGAVSKILSKELEQLRQERSSDVAELRELEAARLDTLQRGLWTTAVQGNPEAVRTVLRLMQRRAQMFGLDVPVEFQMRLAEEQVAYLEAALRRVLDAVQIAVMQAAGEEVVAQLWPTVMGEIVPRELEAAAASVGA